MRLCRTSLVLLLAVGVTATMLGVTPAGAKPAPITGGVRCTISNAVITFNPGLKDRHYIEGKTSGRGPSAAGFTADLSGCTDPSTGPAPGSIDHGTVVGTGHVGGSYCDNISRLKLKSTINWNRSDDTVVGTTEVKLGFTLVPISFNDPRQGTFAGIAKRSSPVFPNDTIGFTLTTTDDNFIISAECFKDELASLGFNDGTLAADPPA